MRSAPPTAASKAPARITIADVARAAGVSKATVSRFFNHREALLTPDIAARVEAAIAALDYRPSPMAQALKRGSSRLIGMVVADVTNPYSVAVLRGAEKACKDAGYLVMLFNLGNEPEREREAIATLSSYQVDGFILNTFDHGGKGRAEVERLGKPAVLVDRRHGRMSADFVSLDNAGAVEMAVAHLVDAGYRELLYVTEPVRNVSSRLDRQAAFHACLKDHADVRGAVFESVEDGAEALEQAIAKLRKRGDSKAAILSGNAVVTVRCATAVMRLGLRFGADIGFIGFDELEWAPLVGPGLTTIAQPTDALGRLAARCLIERLQGSPSPPRQILLSGELVVRGSSQRDGNPSLPAPSAPR
jgi:LacI family kdg operon repressor